MNKVKLMIAESNTEERSRLEEYFAADNEFELTCVAEDGELAIELAKELQPEVVVCNFALRNADGITLCEELKGTCGETKIVMHSSAFSDQCIRRMVDSGVDYYMLRPFDPSSLKKQILHMTQTKAAAVLQEFTPSSSKKIEERTSKILITVGIPAHIKGYQFLREAVRLAIEKPEIINSITKQLYPSIARRFNTSSSKVERAIRHAIEVGWSRGKIENINNLFGVKVYGTNDKPTNGEFIALVADKMLLEGVG